MWWEEWSRGRGGRISVSFDSALKWLYGVQEINFFFSGPLHLSLSPTLSLLSFAQVFFYTSRSLVAWTCTPSPFFFTCRIYRRGQLLIYNSECVFSFWGRPHHHHNLSASAVECYRVAVGCPSLIFSLLPHTQYAAQLIIIISYHPGYSLFY